MTSCAARRTQTTLTASSRDTVVIKTVDNSRDTVYMHRETLLVMSPDSTVLYRRDSISQKTASRTRRDTDRRETHTADTTSATVTQTQRTAEHGQRKSRPVKAFLAGMAAGGLLICGAILTKKLIK